MSFSSSKSVCSEMEENGEERHHPFDIFPEEVWDCIFDKVMNSGDLKNLYKTSIYFQPLLSRNKKSIILFSKVISILAQGGYLKTQHLFQCRLICQSWKTDIDNFHHAQLHQMNIFSHVQIPYRHSQYFFNCGSQVQKFLSAMEPYPFNPFENRRLSLTVTSFFRGLPELEENAMWMKKLLQKYGSKVVYLKITIFCRFPIQGEAPLMMSWLSEYLAFVPNVKVLMLSYFGRKDEINCLPRVGNVEQLQVSTALDPILQKIISCPEKLEQLSISRVPGDHIYPALKVLQTRLDKRNKKILEKSKWLLNELYLYTSDYPCKATFQIAMRFKETLTCLILNAHLHFNNWKVTLPKLRKLRICITSGKLDFLVNLISLEELTVVVYAKKSISGKIIKVKRVGNRFESNVVEVLPKLKKVCFIPEELEFYSELLEQSRKEDDLK